MKRRGFLGLLTAAAFGAMLNVYPAFAPIAELRIQSTRWDSRRGYGICIPYSTIRVTA